MKFSSIEQFKAVAKFFPKGRIIPQRILKGPRKTKHLIVFGGDAWVIPSPNGYLVAVDSEGGGSAVVFKSARPRLHTPAAQSINMRKGRAKFCEKTYTLQGSPYTKNGGTRLIGNHMGDEKWLACLNAELQQGSA